MQGTTGVTLFIIWVTSLDKHSNKLEILTS